MKPFRWNLKKKEQLGSLIQGDLPEIYNGFFNDLFECCSKTLSRCDNKKIVFVGRSPESIFDYLSGVFESTAWQGKLEILNISNRFKSISDMKNELPTSYQALKEHFVEIGISPEQIISSKFGVCFTDLVLSGGTFKQLFAFLESWADENNTDKTALFSKIKFLGITTRTKNSPHTWRWYQNAKWLKKYPQLTAQSISIGWRLWDYLGNKQPKVEKTNCPENWVNESILLPSRDESNITALRLAFHIYNLGFSQKVTFSRSMSKQSEFKHQWLRTLALEVKNTKM